MLSADKTEAVIENLPITSEMTDMENRVTTQEGTIIRIKSVTMERNE